MNEWLKAKLPKGENTEAEIPLIGQSVVLYCCPHDRTKAWESDIGSLDYEEEDGLVWGSAFGLNSGFDGVKFEDILKDYEVCFTEVRRWRPDASPPRCAFGSVDKMPWLRLSRSEGGRQAGSYGEKA
jgi:hypothetical protein